MPRRNMIFRIIYIGLAATSFLFVQKTMNEYLAGKTDYHKSYLPTTMKDFPTITLCFKHKGNLNYGKDFSIGLYQNYSDDKDFSDGKIIYAQLKEGENEVTNSYGITHNLVVDNLVVEQSYTWAGFNTKCIKVSRKSGELDIGMEELDMYLLLSVEFFSIPAPLESALYVTSEANAFGAIYEKWYEGRVEEYTLKNLTLHQINIRVEEIRRLPELCQDHQSYYECVASEFAQDVSCKDLKCLPYTLPSSKILQGLEYCNYTTAEENCNDKVLDSIVKKKDVCKGGKANACVVKEYKLKDYLPPIKREGEIKNGYLFYAAFWESKSLADTSSEITKTVFTEYYILDGYILIGTVGGTLGLMIGFSVIGAITSLVDWVSFIRAKYNRNKEKSKAKKQSI